MPSDVSRYAGWFHDPRFQVGQRQMTDERYHAYRQVMAALATDGATVLTPAERELLCDAAEGYLLMRSRDGEEASELAANVAAVLESVVASRRWREETATAVQNAIEACGPRLEPVAV
jgi:hypothetical protein